MPSIRTLKTFLTVTRVGSFAAAGKEIGLTAAAVGLQMRGLEHELHQPLFDRNGRNVVLNTAGRELTQPIEDMVARFEAISNRRDSGDPLSGTVVMGALVSALMGAFADCLWALKAEHPKLEVKLFAGLSSDFAGRVSRGEIDAAVVTQSPVGVSSNLAWTPLYSEPMVLIVPRRPHFELPATAPEILRRAPFIRFDRQTWTGSLVSDALAQAGTEVSEEMELNSVEAIIALVRQGFGVSIVPRLANVQWSRDRSLAIVAMSEVDVHRHVGLLERTQHSRGRFTTAIKDYFVSRGKRGASNARSG